MALEYAFEAVAERQPVEARRRRDRRSRQLAPERRNLVLLEHEIGHAEQRFAEEAACDAAGDEVVARRRRRLAGDLPHGSAGERIAERLPIVEARRARDD